MPSPKVQSQKLESLPDDLRKIADKLIAKKFNIKPEPEVVNSTTTTQTIDAQYVTSNSEWDKSSPYYGPPESIVHLRFTVMGKRVSSATLNGAIPSEVLERHVRDLTHSVARDYGVPIIMVDVEREQRGQY